MTRVEMATGEVAVKRFAPADAEAAEREAAVLAHLAGEDARYRVQSIVRTADGALLWRDGEVLVLVT
ncbi:MAG: hypothetical protein H0V17_22335, partial [Deltaproteobacteria bacterium]|nr:hypothetical protein [Deltaproteobacteria bacterium]